MNRPWTPAPWGVNYDNASIDGGGVEVAYLSDGGPDVDDELIALAPEMAEAILAWCTENAGPWWDDEETPEDAALFHLADKLRQIGSE